jgi:D-alanyl-lipoteichoic acid acyltransferase DltB (MBOAT superfamily)
VVFNSLQFAGFFVLVFAVVGLASRIGDGLRLRNASLLVASYVFYAAWDWRFLALILVSTAVDYGCALAIERAGTTAARRRRALLGVSLAVNLGLLGFFKYADFFVESAASLLRALGLAAHPASLHVILPVGISFYTFQALSYTIDVYRGRIPAERDPLRYATYVAFFPQLVAGPIERGSTLLPQFARRTRIAGSDLRVGLHLAGWGLFKKVVIADNAAHVSDAAFALPDPTGIQVLLGAFAFAIQIYGDFSGYSDVARGTARCLGFELSRNFELPYFAASPVEFWRRWHVSLSTWLRDYVYVPLGGNRGGSSRTYLNLMATMLLGGLWHGAAFTFVAWGAYHGLLLCLLRPLRGRRLPGAGLARWSAMLATFLLMCLGWIPFRAESLSHAATMLTGLADWPGGELLPALDALGPLRLAAFVTGILLAVELVARRRGELFLLSWPAPLRGLAWAAALVLFLAIGEYDGPEFIYFQF